MRYKEIKFHTDPNVLALGVNGAYLTIGKVTNKTSDLEFEKIKQKIIEDLLNSISENNIQDNKILQGFRSLHEAVNKTGKKYISSPENLLRFLLQNKEMPQVNLLVDIYNLISLKTNLALGAHDIATISGDVHLRLTKGTERFLPLGYQKLQSVSAGEYAYIDDEEIICRLEVRQVEKTKITLATTECFYIIQGNMNTSNEHIRNAVDELTLLTTRFCGGDPHILFLPV